MLVEILVTPGCVHEDAAIDLVGGVALELAIAPLVRLVEIGSLDQARRYRFLGSPTIRVDGGDVDLPPGERHPALSCRLYATAGRRAGVPDRRLVRAALIAAAGGAPGS